MSAAANLLHAERETRADEADAVPTFDAAQAWLTDLVASGDAIEPALEACLDAPSPAHDAWRRYLQVGRLALDGGQWEFAEHAAIRALLNRPVCGPAFKLLGSALRGAGNLEEAASCHRFNLPRRLRDKHFGRTCEWTDSRSAADAGVGQREAYAARRWPLRAPRQMHPREIRELSEKELRAIAGTTTLVPSGRLWFDGFNTVVWDRAGRVLEDICRGCAEVVPASLGTREPTVLGGRVCLLGNRNASNYYHWMNDVLPRLEVLTASGHALEGIDHFVLDAPVHPFQHETLAAFGIGEERLHTIDADEFVSADELLIATYGSNSLGRRQGPWSSAFLKRTFAPDDATDKPATRRLYVSRGSSGPRAIGNDVELAARLARFGFETVRTECLTVREQAALFDAAEAVIGPHGAGFSNIAFCRPGTRIIELFNSHIAPCFWVVSELTGLEHVVHFCDAFDESSRPSDHEAYHRSAAARRASPFAVDADEIEALLRSLDIRPRA